MPLTLDATQRRIVGTLVEKELSVPDTYPLTLNALVAGCNQKNNRDPETTYAEHEVAGALQALMEAGWVTEHEKAGSRTRRYAHRAREQLSVDDADLAILAELMLRGPQSPPELKTRASRMRPLPSVEDVERRLAALAARPVPYVRFLGKRTGERVPRWEHTLSPESDQFGVRPQTDRIPPPGPPPAPGAPSAPPTTLADLAARVERLEKEVEALRADAKRQHGAGDEAEAST